MKGGRTRFERLFEKLPERFLRPFGDFLAALVVGLVVRLAAFLRRQVGREGLPELTQLVAAYLLMLDLTPDRSEKSNSSTM
jgi:hypothetical protein